MFDGGRVSSPKASGPPAPRDDTVNGKSAPQAPGPLIGSMRTLPGPSLTAPELRHAISASRRQASRGSDKNRALQAASTTSKPTTTEPTRTPRTLHTIIPIMHRQVLTPDQCSARAHRILHSPHAIWLENLQRLFVQ